MTLDGIIVSPKKLCFYKDFLLSHQGPRVEIGVIIDGMVQQGLGMEVLE